MNKENKCTVFSFFHQFFLIFGVQVLFSTLVLYLFPADELVAAEFSSSGLFLLGKQGIAAVTLLQFLISSMGVAILVTLFTTDLIFKKMLRLWRYIFMFAGIIVFISFSIIIFGWFPASSVEGWISFFVTFVLFFVVSMLVMVFKTRYESKKYERLLKRFKERNEDTDIESE